MGVSNPNSSGPKMSNPAKFTIEFSGKSDKGYFSYYDKEKKANVEIQKSFRFLILEMWRWRAKSFDSSTNRSYGSNIISDLKNEEVAFWEQGVSGKPQYVFDCWKAPQGTESQVKAVNYYKADSSFFIGLDKSGNRLPGQPRIGLYLFVMLENSQLAVIWLKGNAIGRILGLWTAGNYEEFPVWFKWTGVTDEVSGTNKYKAPTFDVEDNVTAAELQSALALDRDFVSPYLNRYNKKDSDSPEDAQPEQTSFNDGPSQFPEPQIASGIGNSNAQFKTAPAPAPAPAPAQKGTVSQEYRTLWARLEFVNTKQDISEANALWNKNVQWGIDNLSFEERADLYPKLIGTWSDKTLWVNHITPNPDPTQPDYVFSDLPF